METLAQYDPTLIEALSKALVALFAVISGTGTAIWALINFFNDRKVQLEERRSEERQRIEQEKFVERGKRAERVAGLMSDFGKAGDPEKRGWVAMALSMYPHETKRLLAMSLSKFDDETAATIRLALVSMGEPALPEVTRLNRIAHLACQGEGEECATIPDSLSEARVLLERTKLVIVQMLFYLSNDELIEHNFSELDLSGCNMKELKCSGISFRKCKLNSAVLKNASIRQANFRGTLLDKTNLLKTSARGADFTGAEGGVSAIKADLDGACFEHARLQGARFDGASMNSTTLTATNLSGGSLRGAHFHEATFTRARLGRVDATKLRAKRARFDGVKLVGACLNQSDISDSVFEGCEAMGVTATNACVKGARFLNSNLGGINFQGADLTGAEFRGCELGGADFRGAILTETIFSNSPQKNARFDSDSPDQDA